MSLCPPSPPVLGLGHVLALRVEALVRVRGVVHHLELAVLVVVAVAAVHHPVGVPLLVPELPVVPGTRCKLRVCHPDNLRSCRKSGQMSRETQPAASWPGLDIDWETDGPGYTGDRSVTWSAVGDNKNVPAALSSLYHLSLTQLRCHGRICRTWGPLVRGSGMRAAGAGCRSPPGSGWLRPPPRPPVLRDGQG